MLRFFLVLLFLFSQSLYIPALPAAQAAAEPLKPSATAFYTAKNPAGKRPMLTWSSVPGAVSYEIELLSRLPENPNGVLPSRYEITPLRTAYAPGYQADLSAILSDRVYWRVRALDYDKNPIGVFSDAQELVLSNTVRQPLKPLITSDLNWQNRPAPLYPVYAWIPISATTRYEVELLRRPPENPNGTEPSVYRIWSKQVTGFDCYDEAPRITPGTYYWRVRGIDAAGNPVGVFSDTASFTVEPNRGAYAATLGDSITHGGGDISHHPADWEYGYQTYLSFPAVNLGKSGDTSAQIADRFSRDVLPYQPKYLLILAGTNSLRGNVPATEVIKDLISLRSQCQAAGIRPIFLTLPPLRPEAMQRVFQAETAPDWQSKFNRVNEFIRHQDYYIDIAPALTGPDGLLPDYYSVDGLHPGIAGKQKIAQLINENWARVTAP